MVISIGIIFRKKIEKSYNNYSSKKKKLIIEINIDKHPHHKNLNVGDFLIDDRDKNGVSEFSGEHIHFGEGKFHNWLIVKEYLLENI